MIRSVPKYATHLVYLTSADNPKEIEHKIIYSILNKRPKRADIYWFVHVETLDEPYTSQYKVESHHSKRCDPRGFPFRFQGSATHEPVI